MKWNGILKNKNRRKQKRKKLYKVIKSNFFFHAAFSVAVIQ